jgi:hypothetical protein
MSEQTMSAPIYKRVPHAAHYVPRHPKIGHDLEVWVTESAGNERWTINGPTRPEGVPSDAEFQCGETWDGKSYWRWVRIAPLTDAPCAVCARRAK